MNCAARMKEDSPAGESLDCGGRMQSAPTGSLIRISRAKSLPPDVGKVAPKATDEEYTQKSGTLFADELASP